MSRKKLQKIYIEFPHGAVTSNKLGVVAELSVYRLFLYPTQSELGFTVFVGSTCSHVGCRKFLHVVGFGFVNITPCFGKA